LVDDDDNEVKGKDEQIVSGSGMKCRKVAVQKLIEKRKQEKVFAISVIEFEVFVLEYERERERG
jgi:hypothetical protein